MSDNSSPLISLSSLSVGQKAQIVAFSFDTQSGERIRAMGLYPGEQVEVMRLPLNGNPFEIKIRQYFISLDKHEAERIKVILLPQP